MCTIMMMTNTLRLQKRNKPPVDKTQWTPCWCSEHLRRWMMNSMDYLEVKICLLILHTVQNLLFIAMMPFFKKATQRRNTTQVVILRVCSCNWDHSLMKIYFLLNQMMINQTHYLLYSWLDPFKSLTTCFLFTT